MYDQQKSNIIHNHQQPTNKKHSAALRTAMPLAITNQRFASSNGDSRAFDRGPLRFLRSKWERGCLAAASHRGMDYQKNGPNTRMGPSSTKNNKAYLTLDTTKDALKSAAGFKYDRDKTARVPDKSK
jgi:hypothetical protein